MGGSVRPCKVCGNGNPAGEKRRAGGHSQERETFSSRSRERSCKNTHPSAKVFHAVIVHDTTPTIFHLGSAPEIARTATALAVFVADASATVFSLPVITVVADEAPATHARGASGVPGAALTHLL